MLKINYSHSNTAGNFTVKHCMHALLCISILATATNFATIVCSWRVKWNQDMLRDRKLDVNIVMALVRGHPFSVYARISKFQTHPTMYSKIIASLWQRYIDMRKALGLIGVYVCTRLIDRCWTAKNLYQTVGMLIMFLIARGGAHMFASQSMSLETQKWPLGLAVAHLISTDNMHKLRWNPKGKVLGKSVVT